MKTPMQRGFSAVEVVIVVFVLAAISVTGYLAYNRMRSANKTPTAAEQKDKAATPSAPSVNNADDLDKAARTLDATNLDASLSDSAELDSELKAF